MLSIITDLALKVVEEKSLTTRANCPVLPRDRVEAENVPFTVVRL
jgi:hypothetical protein